MSTKLIDKGKFNIQQGKLIFSHGIQAWMPPPLSWIVGGGQMVQGATQQVNGKIIKHGTNLAYIRPGSAPDYN